jgi:hypothetical protein
MLTQATLKCTMLTGATLNADLVQTKQPVDHAFLGPHDTVSALAMDRSHP